VLNKNKEVIYRC